eukprot:scaffold139_cov325-Pavlova_lutheri.AAC.72
MATRVRATCWRPSSRSSLLSSRVRAQARVVRGPAYVVQDNIDTDQIIPAEYLTLVPTKVRESANVRDTDVPAPTLSSPDRCREQWRKGRWDVEVGKR